MGNKSLTFRTNVYFYGSSSDFAPFTIRDVWSGSFNRVGTNNPGYKKVIGLGDNASGQMVVSMTKYSHPRSHSSFLFYRNPAPLGNPGNWYSCVGDQFNPPFMTAYTWTSEKEQVTLQKASVVLLKRLREADHQFQGGVFFGEIVPTLRMLKRPFSSLRDGIKRYVSTVRKRGRNMPDGAPLRKILGDTWLEFSFGWQPLLADVKDASLALIQLYANLRKTRVKANAEQEESKTTVANPFELVNHIAFVVYTDIETRYSVKLYGSLTPLPNADKGLGFLDRAVKMSGFDLTSFVPTVWELIPYSFLIDYFVNVGQVLEAYSTDTSILKWLSMVEKRTSLNTTRYEIDYLKNRQIYYTPPSGEFRVNGIGGAATAEWLNLIRWKFGAITYPGLRFDTGISGKQLTNIGALLAGSRKLRG